MIMQSPTHLWSLDKNYWNIEDNIEATNRFYVQQLPLAYTVQRYSASERVTLPSTDRGLCYFAFGVLLGTELLPTEPRRDIFIF